MNATAHGRGSLVIVGTGIDAVAHTTPAARAAICTAQKVLYAVADTRSAAFVRGLNPCAQSLDYDTSSARRREVYERMVARIIEEVRSGSSVCAVFYGHPGVFAYPTHAAIRAARMAGFEARMLPGISAEDCLIADCGLDPAALGMQSYEATDFLIRPRVFDACSTLILWQIGLLGNMGFFDRRANSEGTAILLKVLVPRYGDHHRCYLYEAATDGNQVAKIEPIHLADLPFSSLTALTTLLVPARAAAPLDQGVMEQLGVTFGK